MPSQIASPVVQVDVEGRSVPFRLEWRPYRWHSMEVLEEADFPLVAIIDGKRYELYSDGKFAEVEK